MLKTYAARSPSHWVVVGMHEWCTAEFQGAYKERNWRKNKYGAAGAPLALSPKSTCIFRPPQHDLSIFAEQQRSTTDIRSVIQ
ncbi:hypothetical protein E2C01_007218 [Portunus trituberculatus]|uniref:Uncharacterized protein n=1 Tax=Portunus trituberculatus TaxID=210409 RepID=A0A5B7CZW7_PORTR|nr:hypothetical protein [Portunus trituberculatus]